MQKIRSCLWAIGWSILLLACHNPDEYAYVVYTVQPSHDSITMHWQNSAGNNIRDLATLNKTLLASGRQVQFLMNGGMFTKEETPLGLYIENGKIRQPLDLKTGVGNFYMQPNGVFYLDQQQQGKIVESHAFVMGPKIVYATQSGPMLLQNGEINHVFNPNSQHLQIRNGVGVKSNGEVVLAMSKAPVSFYQFAQFFQKLGYQQALYLDGFVSRAYAPEQNWQQTDGNFAVMIAVSRPK